MPLHSFQEKLSHDVRAAFDDVNRVVMASPTGSGKTMTACEGILPHMPGPILWIAHRRELIQQAEAHLAAANVDARVSMIQSFREDRTPFRTIVIDEGHHVCAAQYRALFEAFPNSSHLALTATPYRMDGVGLGTCGFKAIVLGPDIYDLTQDGFLAPAVMKIPHRERDGAWMLQNAVSALLDYLPTIHNVLAYLPSVSDAESFSRALRGRKVEAVTVSCDTPEDERRGLADDFREGKIKVLCNHTIFTEGYDAPRVDCVLLNRLTQSRCLWKQMIGRGLRVHPEKPACLILDMAGNSMEHGSIYDREIYSLSGSVESIERRACPVRDNGEKWSIRYQPETKLKSWKPPICTRVLRASLLKRRSISPLRKLVTAL